MNANAPSLNIDGIIIPVTPHPEHEYTISTAEAAAGYGVDEKTIRYHKAQHGDELYPGKHFLEVSNPGFQPTGAANCSPRSESTGAGNPSARQRGLKRGNDTITYWTKRGIVRLGFFIRSERAKRFRDMAEDLVLQQWNSTAPATIDFTGLAQVVGALADELRLLRGEIRESKLAPAQASPVPLRRKAPASKDPAAIAAEGIAQLTEGRQFAFELPFILVADTFATLRLGGLVPRGPGLRSREPKGSASFQSQAGKAIMKHVSGFSFPAHGIEWSVEHKSTSKGSVYEFTPVGEPNQ